MFPHFKQISVGEFHHGCKKQCNINALAIVMSRHRGIRLYVLQYMFTYLPISLHDFVIPLD